MQDSQPIRMEDFLELRVHGIGEVEYLNSLASPRVRRINQWIEVAEPPVLPDHRLKLVNWSRSNRKRTGFLWYLAFPFTLANLAGRMTDGREGRIGRAWWIVQLGSLVLTLSSLAWLVVLLETVAVHLPPAASFGGAGIVPLTATAVLTALLAAKWFLVIRRQAGTSRRGPATILLHAGVVIAGGASLARWPPGELAYPGWPSSEAPAGMRLDAMALWIAVSLAVVLVLPLASIVLHAAGGRRAKRPLVPAAGAGGLLIAALLLMHSVNALVRLVLDNVLGYLGRLFELAPAGTDARPRILLARDEPLDLGDSRLDLFPFLALIALTAFVLAAAAVVLVRPGLGLGALWWGRLQRRLWWHRVIGDAAHLLPLGIPVGAVSAGAAMALAISFGEGVLGGVWLALAVLLLQVAGAAVVLTLLLRQVQPVQEILGKVADIAGFWPVRDHPLAGASYRNRVVAGLGSQLESAGAIRVALVAHSQGSVLAAWLLAGSEKARFGGIGTGERHLITTGSPLASLYAVFFPGYFPPRLVRNTGRAMLELGQLLAAHRSHRLPGRRSRQRRTAGRRCGR
ncbi:hypothetical protein IWX65_002281 [Arthrobacter sp. CAN_A214]|uniref:hypothetical protein n=1 Tax=Arthrobacter sp. CAN_A214 TaxID=2787720 RepID=UPI0018C8F42B